MTSCGPWRWLFLAWARWVFMVMAAGVTVAAPWMVGSEPLAAQWVLLGGAAAAFLSGAVVRWLSPGREDRRRTRALVGSLACGALLVGLLAVQASNPSHVIVQEGILWRLDPVATNPWLPQSLEGPFDGWKGDYLPARNSARFLLIFGMVWLYAAGLALGFVERVDARRWAFCVGLNGILLAAVCLVHRAMGAQLTLWHFSATFDFTRSPVFLYKNHNGAYLASSLAVVLGLAAGRRSGAARRLWEAGAFGLWLATAAVNSRFATAMATLWILLYLGLRYRASIADGSVAAPGRVGRMLRRGLLLLALGGVLATVLMKTGGTAALARFSQAGSDPIDFLRGGSTRVLLRAVGGHMWRDRPLWGWGGGAYLYLFNTYEARVPELKAQIFREQPQLNRFFGPTANCEWIEFLVEYGAGGVAFMVGAIGTLLAAWSRWRGWRDPLSLACVSGTAGLVLHAFFDYILRNPALLVLAVGQVSAAVRLIDPPMTPARGKIK